MTTKACSTHHTLIESFRVCKFFDLTKMGNIGVNIDIRQFYMLK